MRDIIVHVLNFDGLTSHITIILEDRSVMPHGLYQLDRWAGPRTEWRYDSHVSEDISKFFKAAGAVYSFIIEADPAQITEDWCEYWHATKDNASPIGNNCAVAAQWFLKTFANVPEPALDNISLNYFALGVLWPSFLPCPVTLPGRIMSNLQYHMDRQDNPNAVKTANLYTRALLYSSIGLATVVFLPVYMVTYVLALALEIFKLLSSAWTWIQEPESNSEEKSLAANEASFDDSDCEAEDIRVSPTQ
jgi:hypothetical protein